MPPLHPLHVEADCGYGATKEGQPGHRNQDGVWGGTVSATPGEACVGRDCLLDGELSALVTAIAASVFVVHHHRAAIWRLLTERTRRREVLPAFCNPIMVTSISVALHRISPGSQARRRCAADEMRPGSAPQLGGAGDVHGGQTHQNVRRSQSYTRLKSPAMVAEGHAGGVDRDREGWKSLRKSPKALGQQRKVAQVLAVQGDARQRVVQPRLKGDGGIGGDGSQPGLQFKYSAQTPRAAQNLESDRSRMVRSCRASVISQAIEPRRSRPVPFSVIGEEERRWPRGGRGRSEVTRPTKQDATGEHKI